MPKFAAKRTVFMEGRLIREGSSIEKSLIPDVFLKHFKGFDDNGKPLKEAPKKNSEKDEKDAIEAECKKLYGVDLDKRKSLESLKSDFEKIKKSYEERTKAGDRF